MTRYAHQHADHTLVDWTPAAIPAYAVNADLLLQRHKPFAPIDEFVLEAIDAGVDTLEDLGLFLGLEPHVAEHAVAKQLLLENAAFAAAREPESTQRLVLTPPGRQSLTELRFTVPSREIHRFTFDRLLWHAIGDRHKDLLRASQVRDRSMVRLPRAEPRRIISRDVGLPGLARILARRNVDVLSVADIARQEARYLDAMLLVYASDKTDALRLEITIDGVISQRHTEALDRLGGDQAIGMTRARAAKPPALPRDLAARQTPIEEVRELNKARSLRARSAGEKPAVPGGVAVQHASSDDSEIRSLETWEHRLLLEDSLHDSRRRLLLCSPEANATADDDLVACLVDRARAGVEVVVALGPSNHLAPDGASAAERLKAAAASQERLTVVTLKSDLPPSLGWDHTWVASTFPWLARDTARPRLETGVLVREPASVNEMFAQFARSLTT